MMVDADDAAYRQYMPLGNNCGDVDFTRRLLKNYSYEGNFHQQYYYPQIVLNRVLNRLRRQGSATTLNPDDIVSDHVNTVEGIGDSGSWDTSDPASTTVQNLCKPTWFLSSSAEKPEVVDGTKSDQAQDFSSTRETLAKSMSDNAKALLPSAMEAEGKSGIYIASDMKNLFSKPPESVTSEDSVFSEDYTVGNDRISDCDLSVSVDEDDVDSSFSSPRSSTNTVGASGKEYGANVEVESSKDKVISSEDHNGMHSRGKHRTDIHLIIPEPGNGLTDEEWHVHGLDMDAGEAGEALTDSDKEDASSASVASATSFYEDREFDFLKTEPVRRTTSLKTYKTPPGTPHRKKAVRFADALGLDLESVRHILNLEDPPDVPKSAMSDLKIGIEQEQIPSGCGVKYLSALFSQPGVNPAFLKRVKEGKVALENCVICDKDMTISGTIRVANISFHKNVVVRYSTNNWVTHADIITSYVHNSSDGSTDRFSFSLTVPKYFAVGQRLEMAVMYSVEGNTYWDNNYGRNYAVECYARAMPVSESDNTWMHFL